MVEFFKSVFNEAVSMFSAASLFLWILRLTVGGLFSSWIASKRRKIVNSFKTQWSRLTYSYKQNKVIFKQTLTKAEQSIQQHELNPNSILAIVIVFSVPFLCYGLFSSKQFGSRAAFGLLIVICIGYLVQMIVKSTDRRVDEVNN